MFQNRLLEGRANTIDADPTLERLASRLTQWRGQGRMPEGNAFHLAPEAANQLAWFDPEEKSFLNSFLRLSAAQAAEYVAVRGVLLGRPGSDEADWRGILRGHKINHVVVYSSRATEAEKVVANLLNRKREWPLLYLQDGAAVFGWRDPARAAAADSFANLEVALEQLAYDRHDEVVAPVQGPEQAPQPFRWWEAFWKRRPTHAPDLRAATMALTAYEALVPAHLTNNLAAWKAIVSASLLGETAGPITFPVFLATGDAGRRLFLGGTDNGPPAALWLTIRAARRAIQHDPYKAGAYETLGEAYFHLSQSTRERVWAASFPRLGKIRSVQAITAYHDALRLDPDSIVAHDRLARLFGGMGYKDLALKHLREYLRCVRQRGPVAGLSRESLEKHLTDAERNLTHPAKEVEQLTDRFDINSSNLKVFDRANLAGRIGLTGKALEILLESDVAAFGTEGMDLELKLLLQTGNADNVRSWMNQDQEKVLDAYHWNKIQLHAGIGNYALADEELLELERVRALGRDDLTLPRVAGFTLAHGILPYTSAGPFERIPSRVLLATHAMPLETYRLFPDNDVVFRSLWLVAHSLNREAILGVLRGLLALESGRVAVAEERFRHALVVFRSGSAAPFAFEPESVAARDIAERFLRAIAPEKR
jgi:tetratricopeptide (TPR) repeat protein